MPYVDHEAHREYVVEEYPKMLTQKDSDGHDVPVLYPRGHEKQFTAVVFETAEDEAAYSAPSVESPKPPKRK